MKHKQVFITMAAISFIAAILWLFFPSTSPKAQLTSKEQGNILNRSNDVTSVVKTITQPRAKALRISQITSNDSALLVARKYAKELLFPPYSQPLTTGDFYRLKPNYFNPQSVPVDDNGTILTARLSKYRYTYPEPILATLSGADISHAELELIDLSTGNTLLTTLFEKNDENWQAQLKAKESLPNQLQATVKAVAGDKNISIALSLQYIDSIATIEGFTPAVSQDADMVINANMLTRESGLYRIRANLFDANGQPIAQLVSKKKLSKGSGYISLKTHQSVLQGRELPFSLSTFSVELMSPAPGKPTKYGNSVIIKHEIKDFAVSSLSDVPYQPSIQEQQRLQLLKDMAQGS